MKLLFLIHSLSMGGAERVTVNLANHWATKGWNVSIATLTGHGEDFYPLHPSVDRIRLGLAGESGGMFSALAGNAARIRAVRRVLLEHRPDVAVGMMTTANVLLALAASGTGIPVIGSERIHPPALPVGRPWAVLRRWAYGRLDALVALTRPSAAWLQRYTQARRIVVIPNAVPWPLPVGAPVRLPEELLPADRHVLLAVGRLNEQKGFDLLLRAFVLIAARFPAWDLVIVGDGPERPALEQMVRDLGLAQRVVLAGRAGNVGDWYRRADLYVMSSRFEGFPNTLVEAMAHGVPAVSFDCATGPADIIRDGVDGLLVPPEDVERLSDTLARLMSDDAQRLRLASRAVEARERFSLERVASMWEDLFAEVGSVLENE